MAPKRVSKVINSLDYTKLTVNDVLCPVCRGILIKPVTLPCSHGFCSSCFEITTQNANLVCPLCRVRVGSWLRSATKSKKLINEPFWKAIQDHFPLQVQNKLEGNNENAIVCCNKGKESDSNVISKRKSSIKISENLAKNLNFNELQVKVMNESPIKRKNKQIQKITESELWINRSNSIDSECLYFKPIDYRHNPPSEGLAPIKVPTRRPNVVPNIKILAPCGKNQIVNSIESAFARLFSAMVPQDSTAKDISEREVIDAEEAAANNNTSVLPNLKRKNEKSDKTKKRLKLNQKSSQNQHNAKKIETVRSLKVSDNTNSCDSPPFLGFESIKLNNTNNNVKKHFSNNLKSDVSKRILQEQADFELAKKLQEHYNQLSKYPTRSSVHNQGSSKRQVKKIGEIRTPYKVK